MKPIEEKPKEPDTLNGREHINTTIMNKKAIGIVFLIIAALIIAVLSYMKLSSTSTAYQAIFLNNGQVYFGKLSDEDSQYPTLHDVFYLQVAQPLQVGETTSPNMSLVKLGGELHGPTDEMKINRNQILFIETLRPDSRVVQSILQYKKSVK